MPWLGWWRVLEARLSRLRAELARKKLDGFLVTDISNVFYLTGFTGSTAAAIITPGESHILVDPRYTIQATQECSSSRVTEYTGKSTIVAAGELINELGLARLGYEEQQITLSTYRRLRSTVNKTTTMHITKGVVETLRRVKDAQEIEIIRKACKIVDATFDAVVKEIRTGMSEKDVALLIDYTMRKLGADKDGFDTIAAFGPNSACPHHSPGDDLLRGGGFLKMDFGARYRHYNSDITRTVCIGKPTGKQREVYDVVLEAQLKAIDAITPGIPGKEIDSVARDFIASRGYGANFGHGLGHALGILVHDGPALSQTSDVALEPGMVVTVEPGVYIEGWGGVRIEDDVLVTESGCEVLTHATKKMLAI